MPGKVYLGDGVTAGFDGQNIVLTTENVMTDDGLQTTNTIFIELEVFVALVRYAEKMGWKVKL